MQFTKTITRKNLSGGETENIELNHFTDPDQLVSGSIYTITLSAKNTRGISSEKRFKYIIGYPDTIEAYVYIPTEEMDGDFNPLAAEFNHKLEKEITNQVKKPSQSYKA